MLPSTAQSKCDMRAGGTLPGGPARRYVGATLLLEVCVDSLAGLRAAEAGGGGRIQLRSRLDLGGLSPGLELLEGALEAAALPLHVMVRTRPGGFVHPEAEIAAMEAEVRALRERGVAGVVLGTLTPGGEV